MDRGPQAVFRFDATPEIGGGHAMRCFSLADAMTYAGWRCLFAVHTNTRAFINRLGKNNLSFILLPDDISQEPDQIASSLNGGVCDLLIVDHYERNVVFETACRTFAKRIMVIDDLANREHDVDILLDQNLGRKPSDYAGLVSKDCRFLIGPGYALLRPQFRFQRNLALNKRWKRKTVNNILISFGMSGMQEMVLNALQALREISFSGHIVIVIPAGAEDTAQAQAEAVVMGASVRIFHDVEDMANLMAEADVAIGGGGTMSWERCAMGLPALVAMLGDNQVLGTEALSRIGAIWKVVPSNIDQVSLQIKLKEILNNYSLIRRASRVAAEVCDGTGCVRVLEVING